MYHIVKLTIKGSSRLINITVVGDNKKHKPNLL